MKTSLHFTHQSPPRESAEEFSIQISEGIKFFHWYIRSSWTVGWLHSRTISICCRKSNQSWNGMTEQMALWQALHRYQLVWWRAKIYTSFVCMCLCSSNSRSFRGWSLRSPQFHSLVCKESCTYFSQQFLPTPRPSSLTQLPSSNRTWCLVHMLCHYSLRTSECSWTGGWALDR